MQLSFCPLFSGSSGNALLIRYGNDSILVDAGLSASRVLEEIRLSGVDPATLRGILVTHEHIDHIRGVGVLSRKWDLPVYSAEATWSAMEAKLGKIEGRNVRVFEPGEDFFLGDLNVTPFRVPHDAADPVGYALAFGGCKLTILTDIGCLRADWLRQADGSGVVLLESNHDPAMLDAGRYPYELKRRILGNRGHLSNDDAGKAAVELYQHGVKDIILGHLSAENNFPGLAYESVAMALKGAGCLPGEDLRLSVARRDGLSDWHILTDWALGA